MLIIEHHTYKSWVLFIFYGSKNFSSHPHMKSSCDAFGGLHPFAYVVINIYPLILIEMTSKDVIMIAIDEGNAINVREKFSFEISRKFHIDGSKEKS